VQIVPDDDREAWDALDEETRARFPWLDPGDFTVTRECETSHGCAEAYDALRAGHDALRADGHDPHDLGPEYRALRDWRDGDTAAR
jgi:hypothetical protein